MRLPDESGLLYEALLTLRDEEKHVNGQSDEVQWRHMHAFHEGTRKWFEEHTELDKSIIDNMVAEDTRPRILIRDEGVLLIFRAMNYNDPDKPEDMISLRMWVDCEHIYTTRCRDMKTVEDMIGEIEAGRGPQTPGEFLTRITNHLYSRMEFFIDQLEDGVSLAEEKITNDEIDEVARNVRVIRRRNAIFRRYIIPQRQVLDSLTTSKLGWISEDNREELIENRETLLIYIETINDVRDRTQILNEEIRNVHAEQLNSTTYIFSIAATIFLPLGFLTGLMGINVGGMPGVESDIAFWSFAGLCAMIVIVQVLLFRRLKWF